MQNDLIFWLIATFAAVSVGLGKGGLPVVAALAVPSLALFMSPIAAAGLLLPVYIVSDIFALVFYRKDYNAAVLKIGIVGAGPSGLACGEELRKLGYKVSAFDPQKKCLHLIDRKKVDIIFNALHGKDGEDGVAQSYFEYLRIPYTHSGAVSYTHLRAHET